MLLKQWIRGKKGLAASVALSLVLLVAGCGGQSSAPGDGGAVDSAGGGAANTVKIGLIQPMSGNNSAYGIETQAGFEFVINKINAEGGIKSLGGAKIELVLADSASDPGKAANEARRLITQENVSLLAGTLLSNEMGSVAPIAEQYKMPTVSFWAAGSRSSYFFSLGFPYDRGYAATMVAFLDYLSKEKQLLPIKNVVLASSNYEAGQAVDKAAARRLEEAGYTVAGTVPLDQNAQDLTSAVLRMKSMNPDAVIGLVTAKDGIQLHRARFNANYLGVPFLGGTSGYSDPVLWKELGDSVAPVALTQGMFGMTPYAEKVQLEPLQELLAEAKATETSVVIGQNYVHGAQAARMIQAILEEAGSTDRDAIYQAIMRVHIPAGSPHLYLPREGGLKFGEDRMLEDVTALVIQWQADGSQEVVYPPSLATAEPRID